MDNRDEQEIELNQDEIPGQVSDTDASSSINEEAASDDKDMVEELPANGAPHSDYDPTSMTDSITHHLSGMYQNWFLDYASYVILERAVPHILDGFKPVQRRILHSMKRMDDGRMNKVANIVGHTMQFHPHGDASIKDALVQMGQKELLIDCQGLNLPTMWFLILKLQNGNYLMTVEIRNRLRYLLSSLCFWHRVLKVLPSD